MRIKIIATLVLVVATGAPAQNGPKENPAQAARPGATDSSCIFDFERGEVPNCVRLSATGQLFIESRVLKDLHFDSHGLASVLSRREGWMYVARTGRVVVSGVPSMDNGPDSFHNGLVRVVKNEKYGFANRQGKLMVPPIYDGAMNFENGRAKVCKGCESKCVGRSCEYHSFVGGDWFQIDTQGTVVARDAS